MAIQYYTPNQLFQISSVSLLKSAEQNNYTWEGRTLTGWLDSENRVHEISSDAEISTSFPNMTAGISGLWKLDEFPVSLKVLSNDNDRDSIGGIACISADTTDYTSRYYPLSSRVYKEFNLSNGEVSSVYYGPVLSIKLSASNGYMPVKFSIDYQKDNWDGNIHKDLDPNETFIWSQDEYCLKNYLSVTAEFSKGVLTYYPGKNIPSPVL